MPSKAKTEKKPDKDKVMSVYYVGHPAKPETTGQDKYGHVHCLVWVYYKRESARRYSLWSNGCGIGEAKSVKEAKAKLREFAMARLGFKLIALEDELLRVKQAMDLLSGGPMMLEMFAGKYRSTP